MIQSRISHFLTKPITFRPRMVRIPRVPCASLWLLAIILIAGTSLRIHHLGTPSFWYDEVVTMRLAETANPRALTDLLSRIDATRAPLYPLILQQWIRVFGRSEAAARWPSVAAGVLTIVLIFAIGRTAFDTATGVWGALLAAISPILIFYSRETRMYAWLVLFTCLAWYLLLEYRRNRSRSLALGYGLTLVVLIYTHPLGLLMAATLAFASLVAESGGLKRFLWWPLVHGAAAMAALPWIGRYFDHRPEFLSGPLPIRFLLGTPIGFIGGDSYVLLGIACLTSYGLLCFVATLTPELRIRIDHERSTRVGMLLLWMMVPPAALYVYSLIADPIFGPPRYTIFVAPAYLILVGAGLRYVLPRFRYPVAFTLCILAGLSIGPRVYALDLKADWRAFGKAIAKIAPDLPHSPPVVIVASSEPGQNLEVETARYYLPPTCEVIADEELKLDQLREVDSDSIFFAVGARDRDAAAHAPEWLGAKRLVVDMRFPGLVVYRPGY